MDIEQLREQSRSLCQELGVAIIPYGPAWWLVGNGVNRVVADLAGLCRSDLMPLPLSER